jgi:hypothetical protein
MGGTSSVLSADSSSKNLDRYIKSTREVSDDNARLCDQVFDLEWKLLTTRTCLAVSMFGNIALIARYRRLFKK